MWKIWFFVIFHKTWGLNHNCLPLGFALWSISDNHRMSNFYIILCSLRPFNSNKDWPWPCVLSRDPFKVGNVLRKSKTLMKVINLEQENLCVFFTTWGI